MNPEIPILFWDDALLVINKPAGLPTLPDGYDPSAPHVKSVLEAGFGRLWIVHRLDRDTSGVLALARTADAHRALNTQFNQRQIEKVYHALVAGSPAWDETRVELPLRVNVGHHHRTVADVQRGKPSLTEFRILQRFEGFALVEALPRTGRTHQIRVHLSAIGFPIVADTLYGGATSNLPLTRMWLHARSLAFEHPATGEPLRVEAPYPDDLAGLLRALHSSR